jgi:hypothetical protein
MCAIFAKERIPSMSAPQEAAKELFTKGYRAEASCLQDGNGGLTVTILQLGTRGPGIKLSWPGSQSLPMSNLLCACPDVLRYEGGRAITLQLAVLTARASGPKCSVCGCWDQYVLPIINGSYHVCSMCAENAFKAISRWKHNENYQNDDSFQECIELALGHLGDHELPEE